MRTVRTLRTMLTAAAVVATVAGCGAIIDGDPKAEGTSTTTGRDLDKIAVFNPCSELPDNVLTQVGLDPSSKMTITDPPSGPSSWRVCDWKPEHGQFAITVFSTSHTIEEARTNDDLVGFRDVTIGPRPGLTFHDDFDSDKSSCHAAFPAEQGMFQIAAGWTFESARDRDICSIATEYAAALEPHLPQ